MSSGASELGDIRGEGEDELASRIYRLGVGSRCDDRHFRRRTGARTLPWRDGSVRIFKGADLSPAGRIELGSDADNVRVDSKARRVFIGHGDGALAVIDADSQKAIVSAALNAHPESFQLDANTGRIFVNVPNAGSIDVVDRTSGKKIASWPT